MPILARRLFECVDLLDAGQRAVLGVAIALGATIAVFTPFPAHSWLSYSRRGDSAGLSITSPTSTFNIRRSIVDGMTGSRIASLRERIDTTDLGALVVVLAALHVTTDGALESMISVFGALLTVPLFSWVLEAADIDDATAALLLGSVVAALGVGAVVFGGSIWIGTGALAVGCWLVLDTVYESRTGTGESTAVETETGTGTDEGEDAGDITEAEMYTLVGHSRWVIEALQEASRPLSAAELRERTGLTNNELEDVLEIARENGTVERVGNGYVVDESELGGVAFGRGIVRGVGGRLLRPFRLFRPSE